MTAPAGGADGLPAIEQDMLRAYFARRPFAAAQLGVEWAAGQMPPVTAAATDALVVEFQQIMDRVGRLADGRLSAESRLTARLISEICGYEIASLRARWPRFTVSPLPEAGLAAQILVFGPYASIGSADAAQTYLDACGRIGPALDEAVAELRIGRTEGLVPVRSLMAAAVRQIEEYLARPVTDDPFLGVLTRPGASAPDVLVDRARRLVVDSVRPAFARYADEVRGAMATGRDDDHVGVGWLPGGTDIYAAAVREHTTLPLEPGAVHERGLGLITDLKAEATAVAARLGWRGTFDDTRDRLRTDRSLAYADADDMLAVARAAMDRATAQVPTWITDLPAASCEVRPMHPWEAPHGVLGHYETAPLDRSGPAVYWLNTADPTSRGRFEGEALAFHESVPGHHLEIAASQEITSESEFRRLVQVLPYSEGWALYMERFADEIGLYSDDLARLGMISFALWRAGRLVVDTGLHAFGWSRPRAVDYLWHNTMLGRTNIENEVDRYIAHPGSALGYMVGHLAMRQLRAGAIGDSTDPGDLRGFHHGLLGGGPLTLGLLSARLGVDLTSTTV